MKTQTSQLIFILIETAILDLGSQKALSKKLGRAESTISNWRIGKTCMPAEEFLKMFAWYRQDDVVRAMFEEVLHANS